METATIINAIDAELEILVRVKEILSGHEPHIPTLKPHRKRRILSAQARKAISEGQKRRWAAQKKAAKAAA
jgi:hypothetical protein